MKGTNKPLPLVCIDDVPKNLRRPIVLALVASDTRSHAGTPSVQSHLFGHWIAYTLCSRASRIQILDP